MLLLRWSPSYSLLLLWYRCAGYQWWEPVTNAVGGWPLDAEARPAPLTNGLDTEIRCREALPCVASGGLASLHRVPAGGLNLVY